MFQILIRIFFPSNVPLECAVIKLFVLINHSNARGYYAYARDDHDPYDHAYAHDYLCVCVYVHGYHGSLGIGQDKRLGYDLDKYSDYADRYLDFDRDKYSDF